MGLVPIYRSRAFADEGLWLEKYMERSQSLFVASRGRNDHIDYFMEALILTLTQNQSYMHVSMI